MSEESKAYSRGYQAGRKRERKDEIKAAVRNQRLTDLTVAIMSSGMQGQWGETTDGKFKKHSLEKLERMAEKSAYRMVLRMDVFT